MTENSKSQHSLLVKSGQLDTEKTPSAGNWGLARRDAASSLQSRTKHAKTFKEKIKQKLKRFSHSPTEQPLAVLDKQLPREGLGQHIRGLVFGPDLVEGEGPGTGTFPVHPAQPMEIFHIDVLGARSGLGELCDGQSTTVVFETEQWISFLSTTTGKPRSFISIRMR